MDNKERLDGIREAMEETVFKGTYDGGNQMHLDILWLMDEAERAQSLEAENAWLYGKLNQIGEVIDSGRREAKKFGE